MTQNLHGLNALVTGAARGIGQGIAVELAKSGANVMLNDLNETSETESLCREFGVRVGSFQGDASSREVCEGAVQKAIDTFGSINIAVSNAAYSDRERFNTAGLAGFERTINVCMWGPYYLARAASNAMIAQGKGGSLVFISSPHAYKAIPGATAYNMAKAAIDQLARTAAVELAEYNIRSNLIHPGWTDTPGERKFFSEETLRERAKQLPLGRLARPDDIARGVVFLVDPANDYITGTTLLIDGGINLPWDQMHRLKEKPAAQS